MESKVTNVIERKFTNKVLQECLTNGDAHTKAALATHLDWFETQNMPSSWFDKKNITATKIKTELDLLPLINGAVGKETFFISGSTIVLKLIPSGKKSVKLIDQNFGIVEKEIKSHKSLAKLFNSGLFKDSVNYVIQYNPIPVVTEK